LRGGGEFQGLHASRGNLDKDWQIAHDLSEHPEREFVAVPS
jgi:hypothetical protein